MEKFDIYVERTNASFVRVLTDDLGILTDLYESFKFEEPTFQKSRFSRWDGITRLFNKDNCKLPAGLLQVLLTLCKQRGYTYKLDPRFKNEITQVTKEELKEWAESLQLCNDLGERIEIYPDQLEALYLSIRYNRMTILAATSAGKSLVLYLLIRYYDMMREAGENRLKTIIIVPSVNLTLQLFKNFQEFSTLNGWKVQEKCHIISEGSIKVSQRPIYISTWQSIQKEDKDYYEQFGNVLVDEAHTASAKCVKTICENSINAYQRIGMTGTLKNTELHPLAVQGNFGPIRRVVTTKQLQDQGRAAQTLVTRIQLNYQTEERNLVFPMTYTEEIEFLIGHPNRNRVIKNLARGLKGNSLFLFDRKDKHQLKVLDEILAEGLGDKKIFVINGDVDGEDRIAIQKIAEAETDVVIFASYGTMSTGVSVRNLHNLILCHPTKSIIRVLQSIGRMLRLHKTKDLANIYDIFDNLESRSQKNTTLEHAIERLGFYEQEQHRVRNVVMEIQPAVSTVTAVTDFVNQS